MRKYFMDINGGFFPDNSRIPLMLVFLLVDYLSTSISQSINVCDSYCYCKESSLSCRRMDTLTEIPQLIPEERMANITEMCVDPSNMKKNIRVFFNN